VPDSISLSIQEGSSKILYFLCSVVIRYWLCGENWQLIVPDSISLSIQEGFSKILALWCCYKILALW
jgi:hypothetical protein